MGKQDANRLMADMGQNQAASDGNSDCKWTIATG